MQAIANLLIDDPWLKMPKAQRLALHRQRRTKLRYLSSPSELPFLAEPAREVAKLSALKEPWFHIVEEIEPDIPVAKCPRIEDVIRVVTEHFGITRMELMSDRRTKDLVLPRHIGFYICKKLTMKSYPLIAKRFGYYDHSVGIFAVKKISRLLETDAAVMAHVDSITMKLNGVGQ